MRGPPLPPYGIVWDLLAGLGSYFGLVSGWVLQHFRYRAQPITGWRGEQMKACSHNYAGFHCKLLCFRCRGQPTTRGRGWQMRTYSHNYVEFHCILPHFQAQGPRTTEGKCTAPILKQNQPKWNHRGTTGGSESAGTI